MSDLLRELWSVGEGTGAMDAIHIGGDEVKPSCWGVDVATAKKLQAGYMEYIASESLPLDSRAHNMVWFESVSWAGAKLPTGKSLNI